MTTAGALFAAAEGWPVVGPDAITGGCALILAPHPDDESLGCGGLIARSCAEGHPPVVVMLTDGAGSHPGSRTHPADRLRSLREAETEAATACLGLPRPRLVFLGYPDTAAPTSGPGFDAAVAAVCDIARRHACRSMLASWRHDPHCDHEAASFIADAAARRLGIAHRAYPVWGRTLPPDTAVETVAGLRLDVAPWQGTKRRAVLCHRSQWAGIIADDPAGFQMQPDFMQLFDTPYEVFLEVA